MNEHEPWVDMGPWVEPEGPVIIRRVAPNTRTRWVWLVAVSALAQVVIIGGVAYVARGLTWPAIIVVLLVGALATLYFAGRDQAELEAQDVTGLPARLNAIIPVLWLILRARVVWPLAHEGWGPVWAHLLATAIAYNIFTGALPLIGVLQETRDYWLNFTG